MNKRTPTKSQGQRFRNPQRLYHSSPPNNPKKWTQGYCSCSLSTTFWILLSRSSVKSATHRKRLCGWPKPHFLTTTTQRHFRISNNCSKATLRITSGCFSKQISASFHSDSLSVRKFFFDLLSSSLTHPKHLHCICDSELYTSTGRLGRMLETSS